MSEIITIHAYGVTKDIVELYLSAQLWSSHKIVGMSYEVAKPAQLLSLSAYHDARTIAN
jgi:hypothetical protein